MRYVLTPVTAFVLTAALAASADAVEESVDVAPEIVTSDQIATQESADSVVDGPSKSAVIAAVDRALGALPEIGADSDVGPMRCDNPVRQWVQVSNMKDYHVPSWWNGTNFKDGPGGSMRVSVEKAGKTGVEVSGTAGVSASVILAEVKEELTAKGFGSGGHRGALIHARHPRKEVRPHAVWLVGQKGQLG
ncbi:hypothetical protein ACFC0C_24920 [Streptomyces sp. NPDC056178]|uniref:hypothetical protein n=1 Tax=unclassified Streptomyces TaxID=2593676 RepID=UPI0035DD3B43